MLCSIASLDVSIPEGAPVRRLSGVLVVILALISSLGPSACQSMLPKLQAPRLSVSAIAFGPGANMQQQPIQLTLHAVNPNDRAISIRSIDCKLDIENQSFAQGETAAAFILPAKGEADFDVNVTANLNSALIALAGGLGHHTVGYRVYGEVHLKGSFLHSIPFDQKGRVKL
jgi:LEA14-like dessication related protein